MDDKKISSNLIETKPSFLFVEKKVIKHAPNKHM